MEFEKRGHLHLQKNKIAPKPATTTIAELGNASKIVRTVAKSALLGQQTVTDTVNGADNVSNAGGLTTDSSTANLIGRNSTINFVKSIKEREITPYESLERNIAIKNQRIALLKKLGKTEQAAQVELELLDVYEEADKYSMNEYQKKKTD